MTSNTFNRTPFPEELTQENMAQREEYLKQNKARERELMRDLFGRNAAPIRGHYLGGGLGIPPRITKTDLEA